MNVTSERSTRTFLFASAILLNSLSILSAPSMSMRPERETLVMPFSWGTTSSFIGPSSFAYLVYSFVCCFGLLIEVARQEHWPIAALVGNADEYVCRPAHRGTFRCRPKPRA